MVVVAKDSSNVAPIICHLVMNNRTSQWACLFTAIRGERCDQVQVFALAANDDDGDDDLDD